MALGLWVIASPWILGFSDISIMRWSNVVVGTAVFLINFWDEFREKKQAVD